MIVSNKHYNLIYVTTSYLWSYGSASYNTHDAFKVQMLISSKVLIIFTHSDRGPELVYTRRISSLKSRDVSVRHRWCKRAIQQMENPFCTWIFADEKSRGDDFRLGELRGVLSLADRTSAWQYLKRRDYGSRERFPSEL